MSGKVIMRFHGHDVEGDAETLARINTELADRTALLALAKQYASECAGCDGTGVINVRFGGDGHAGHCAGEVDAEAPCPECADIVAVIAAAERKS